MTRSFLLCCLLGLAACQASSEQETRQAQAPATPLTPHTHEGDHQAIAKMAVAFAELYHDNQYRKAAVYVDAASKTYLDADQAQWDELHAQAQTDEEAANMLHYMNTLPALQFKAEQCHTVADTGWCAMRICDEQGRECQNDTFYLVKEAGAWKLNWRETWSRKKDMLEELAEEHYELGQEVEAQIKQLEGK